MTTRGPSVARNRFALGVPYALAIGHVLLVALFPAGIEPASLAIIEGAFVLLALAVASQTSSPRRFVGAVVAGAFVLGGTAWLFLTASLWLAALGTLTVLAVVAYGIHRYAYVTLEATPDVRVDEEVRS